MLNPVKHPVHTLTRALILTALSLVLVSCETTRPLVINYPEKEEPRRTVTHTVAPGETLWRISKMYNVPIAAILSANDVSDETKIKTGRNLIIPHAGDVQPVISLYPSRKWDYIIIHHTATEAGSSLSLNEAHLARGWDRGVGYHFVIDNGTKGKKDGMIETTPRWLKQEDGAHCKASDMNTRAIGISLVGNFDEDFVSPRQMASLVFLVKKLKNYYKIPDNHILGHGQVTDARTECPGKNFPWASFKSSLR